MEKEDHRTFWDWFKVLGLMAKTRGLSRFVYLLLTYINMSWLNEREEDTCVFVTHVISKAMSNYFGAHGKKALFLANEGQKFSAFVVLFSISMPLSLIQSCISLCSTLSFNYRHLTILTSYIGAPYTNTEQTISHWK